MVLQSHALTDESFPGDSCGQLSSRRRHTSSLMSTMALKQAPNESVGLWIYVFTHAFYILFLLAFTQGLCTNFDRPLSHRSMQMILIVSICEQQIFDTENNPG